MIAAIRSLKSSTVSTRGCCFITQSSDEFVMKAGRMARNREVKVFTLSDPLVCSINPKPKAVNLNRDFAHPFVLGIEELVTEASAEIS
jgi:hypothetical protein